MPQRLDVADVDLPQQLAAEVVGEDALGPEVGEDPRAVGHRRRRRVAAALVPAVVERPLVGHLLPEHRAGVERQRHHLVGVLLVGAQRVGMHELRGRLAGVLLQHVTGGLAPGSDSPSMAVVRKTWSPQTMGDECRARQSRSSTRRWSPGSRSTAALPRPRRPGRAGRGTGASCRPGPGRRGRARSTKRRRRVVVDSWEDLGYRPGFSSYPPAIYAHPCHPHVRHVPPPARGPRRRHRADPGRPDRGAVRRQLARVARRPEAGRPLGRDRSADEVGAAVREVPAGEGLAWRMPIGSRSTPVVFGNRIYLVRPVR